MPTYNARCETCGKQQEYVARISEKDALLPECPGHGKMVPAIIGNVGGVILKGTGWFGTGFSGSGKKKD